MKENPCVITTFNSIGNDWNHCQLLESLPITGNAQNGNLSVNTVNVWHSS